MNRNELINLLQKHLIEIKALHYPDYASADVLYHRTKMFASKYFSDRLYGIDLVTVNFHSISTLLHSDRQAWDNGLNKLIGIAQAMLDDATLTQVELPITKIIDDTSKIAQLTDQFNQLKSKFENNLYEEKNKYAQLLSKHKTFKKWVTFIILLIVFTTILWLFNNFLKWSWLSTHPKKIALYISFQMLIIFSLLTLVTPNKIIKLIDIVIAIGIVILSII
jgi:hypothetical protein